MSRLRSGRQREALSRENVAVIRRGYEEFAAGRLADYVEELAHPQFELDMSGWGPATYSYRGPGGLRNFLEALDRLWERFDIEPERFVSAGARVVVVIQVDARARDSGVEVRARYANTWTFRDGKVIRAEWIEDPVEALAAVGVRE
jgi:ketosteroid isomerase-like protein